VAKKFSEKANRRPNLFEAPRKGSDELLKLDAVCTAKSRQFDYIDAPLSRFTFCNKELWPP